MAERRTWVWISVLVVVIVLVSAVAAIFAWTTGFTSADSTDPLAPKVFNSSLEARGGNIISIQGANFDPSTTVYETRDAIAPVPLRIVNRVAKNWMAVQLPESLTDPTLIQVSNAHGKGPLLRINAALPQSLDATQIVPGGKFRVFGRSLKAAGHRPIVRVEGVEAQVDEGASDENMLVVTAPTGLKVVPQAEIQCDNGNGAGPTILEGGVRVVAGSGDPLRLGVSWGAGFAFSSRVVSSGATCDGKTDVTQVVTDAIKQASKSGGAVVELPAGNCRISGTINLASNVVLRGAGQEETAIQYEGNFPIVADGLDLVGLQSLQVVNAGQVHEGAIWKNNTRSFIQNVAINMQVSRQWFFTSNKDFLFDHNKLVQSGSYDAQNPYRFDGSVGLVFSNNQSTNVNGSPTFQSVHDSVFLNNRFTRDASSQNEATVVVHHGLVLDFAYRVAVIGNTFDVVNGPIESKSRNDGETILVEGGGGSRTENIGSVESAESNTLTDPTNGVNVEPFGAGIPENLGIAIVSGEGAGQMRRIVGKKGTTLQVDRDWDVIPGPGSHYSTFVWGLEKALIKGNVLIDNPRGIWLYQSSVRDVAILNNEIRNGGGIYLRSYQNLHLKMFTVQANIIVSDNRITNDAQRWLSYITLAEVSADTAPFGTGQFGIEIRRNTIVANPTNIASSQEDYASREGYTSLVHVEADKGPSSVIPHILGTIFQNNSCERCDRAYLIGAGDFGTVLADNKPEPASTGFLTDFDFYGKPVENAPSGGATGTFVR
jgi:hypothetical protein